MALSRRRGLRKSKAVPATGMTSVSYTHLDVYKRQLYRHGYMVGKYISIESLIEKTKDNYYAALKQSSEHWHEGKNDIWPFMRYMSVSYTHLRGHDPEKDCGNGP